MKPIYSFKIEKNGAEKTVPFAKSTDDKIQAYEIWTKMQGYCERNWGLFGYVYSITMFKDGTEIHHIDYDC